MLLLPARVCCVRACLTPHMHARATRRIAPVPGHRHSAWPTAPTKNRSVLRRRRYDRVLRVLHTALAPCSRTAFSPLRSVHRPALPHCIAQLLQSPPPAPSLMISQRSQASHGRNSKRKADNVSHVSRLARLACTSCLHALRGFYFDSTPPAHACMMQDAPVVPDTLGPRVCCYGCTCCDHSGVPTASPSPSKRVRFASPEVQCAWLLFCRWPRMYKTARHGSRALCALCASGYTTVPTHHHRSEQHRVHPLMHVVLPPTNQCTQTMHVHH